MELNNNDIWNIYWYDRQTENGPKWNGKYPGRQKNILFFLVILYKTLIIPNTVHKF